MLANLSFDQKIELVELLEEKQRRVKHSTVVGLVCPDKGLTHCIKKVSGEWITVTDKAEVFLPAKLERVITSTKRFIIVIGGRGSAKSISIGDICLIKAKDEGVKTYCLREYQSSIKNSVHSLLKAEKERLGFEGFEALDNSIRYNGEDAFQFAGLARNVDSIKSAHGFKNYWTEESQTVSDASLKSLTPTARNAPNKGLPLKFLDHTEKDEEESIVKQGAGMIFSANPARSEDAFSQRFIIPFKDVLDRDGIYEDNLHLIVVMNYVDNPWYEESGLEDERAFDYDFMSRAKYRWIWEGDFNDDVEDSIIEAEWFDAAIDAHKVLGFEPRGLKVCAHDPSDRGADAKGLALRHGVVLMDVDENTKDDVNDGADWAADRAIQFDADVFAYDSCGLGATLRRQINSSFKGKKTMITPHNGASAVDNPNQIYQGKNEEVNETRKPKSNKETFKNKRAQDYISLADRFYLTYRAVVHKEYHDPDTLISISSNIKLMTKLRSEICGIPLKPNGAGLIQIMDKAQMRSIGIKSPNLSDSVNIAYSCTGTVKSSKPEHISLKFTQR